MKYAIQWYDPYDRTRAGKAKKDGKPVGYFDTKEEAEQHAENTLSWQLGDATYKIVRYREL